MVHVRFAAHEVNEQFRCAEDVLDYYMDPRADTRIIEICEMCYDQDRDFNQAFKNAVWHLMQIYKGWVFVCIAITESYN